MKIEYRNIETIIPYEKNPRKNEAAVAVVAKSIEEFGWRQPIVVDEHGVIIAGHTRWKAARSLQQTTVPVHVAAGLTEAQVKALRIADNRSADIAEWDMDLLPQELEALQGLDFDLDLLGWTPDELRELMAPAPNPGLVDPDDVPAPPDEATTKLGDLWVLGNHRLLCGDSASVADVDRLVGQNRIHLVNSDPPYNVRVEPRSNNAIAAGLSSFPGTPGSTERGHHQQFDAARRSGQTKGTTKKLRAKDRPLANDFVTDDQFDKLLDGWFGNMSRVLIPGGGFYIWGGYANLGNYPAVLKRHELYFSQSIVWDKQHPVLTRKDFMGAFELAFYGWREGAAHRYFGPSNATDLWHVKKVNPQSMVHLTEKPVELAARAIQFSSKAGENVLDLFGGSGSTLIAAEMHGRRAFLMELDPLYCDVIVQRWEGFTGKKATRIASDSLAEEKAPMAGASEEA